MYDTTARAWGTRMVAKVGLLERARVKVKGAAAVVKAVTLLLLLLLLMVLGAMGGQYGMAMQGLYQSVEW